MKKLFLLSLLLLMAVCMTITSCDDDKSSFAENNAKHITQYTERRIRSYEEALTIAEQSISMLDDPETRGGFKRTVNQADTRYIMSNATRAEGSADTLLYVFNFAENAGFAIVSANAAATGLLAVTEKGNLNQTSMNNHAGIKLFLEMAKMYVKKTRFTPFVDTLSTQLISERTPLIQVKWGQTFPEGVYCANTLAGCANTAVAQIMSYFGYPTQLSLDYPQADSSFISLNWADIRKHIQGSNSYASHTGCLASEEAHKDIGRLCRQCAYLNYSTFFKDNMVLPETASPMYDYNSYIVYTGNGTGTGTAFYNERLALLSLGYSVSNRADYSSMCTQMYLDSCHPILMVGKKNIDEGHVWIVDGYKYYEDQLLSYITPSPSIITNYRYYLLDELIL